jgi:hypothetical protein
MPTKSAAWLVRHKAQRWLTASSCPFATYPIKQGTLLRLLLRVGQVTPETGGAGVTGVGVTHRSIPAWLAFEPPVSDARMLLTWTLWPGGERRMLAEAHPHGQWMRWRGEGWLTAT